MNINVEMAILILYNKYYLLSSYNLVKKRPNGLFGRLSNFSRRRVRRSYPEV